MSPPQLTVQPACIFCKRQKRRCDRLKPRCSTCRRRGQGCEYALDKQNELDGLRGRVNFLEQALQSRREEASDTTADVQTQVLLPGSFPSAFFLDASAFRKKGMRLPELPGVASEYILMSLGSFNAIRHVVDTYFATSHRWLPIIWKRKIEQQILNDVVQLQGGAALLLASMKLVTEKPDAELLPAQSPLYSKLKYEIFMLENQGYMTIDLLQAMILVTTFELGHGIYPAAFRSAGNCINLAHAMGLQDRSRATQAITRPSTWGENEELTRVWCAVLILDRYVHLGSEHRPLTSGNFAENEILPCDTSSWDRGEPSTSIPLFVTSATSIKTDPFARTCQAAHLLGRIMSHRDDIKLAGPERFTCAKQLLATIDSLISLIASEVESTTIAFVDAYATALSGKMILLDMYACTDTNRRVNCVEETELQAIALDRYPSTLKEAHGLAKKLLSLHRFGADLPANLSPLVGDCLYQGADGAAWYLTESGSDQWRDARDTFVQALHLMAKRWNVAEEYLKLVETA